MQQMATVNAMLSLRASPLTPGSALDATLLAALTSTENEDAARNPDMHPAKKGGQWHLGMKAHIGAGADAPLVHTGPAQACQSALRRTEEEHGPVHRLIARQA